jgi:hypothetical protein
VDNFFISTSGLSMMDLTCFLPCVLPILFILAILIFVEHSQVKKFNHRLHTLGPRFIRIDLPLEIVSKLKQEDIGRFSMQHGEWLRLDNSTFLFYWSGRSEKRNPSPIPLKGRVILHEGNYYAEGRLNIASLAFFIFFGIIMIVWGFTDMNIAELSSKDILLELAGTLTPFGFIVISVLIERGNYKEILRDLGPIIV